MAGASFLFFALACGVCASASAKGVVSYDAFLNAKNLMGYRSDIKCQISKPGLSCLSCNTVELCDATGMQVVNVTCPSEAPYCSTKDDVNNCGIMADLKCGQAETEPFPCAKAGYFPDPKACGKYHYCDESFSAVFFTCPAYNPTTKTCSADKCQNSPVNCPPDSAEILMVPFTVDAHYYAYCFGGNPLMVSTCDNDGEVMHQDTQKCGPPTPP